MYLKEFYEEIHGDYRIARKRFFTDAMLLKFLDKFLEEPWYTELCEALDHGERDRAIHAAHTLSGHARGFGFTALEKNSAALMQALRCDENDKITELRDSVTAAYCGIVDKIRLLQS